MHIALAQCPKYLLDAVEIFVIEFYDLTNTTKGYNKTTGGRNGYRLTKEVRMKMSNAHKGPKNHMFGKTHAEEALAKMSIAKTGPNNPFFGKTHSEEVRDKMSDAQKGPKNHKSKPVCVFGKLYDAASIASDTLCDVCDTRSQGNFIKDWTYTSKHQHNVFYVSKEFYNAMIGTSEIITRYMYEQWSS